MSKIMRFTSDKSGYMLGQKDGGWVRYQDHLAEVERLTSERDAAQAEVERLQNSANLWQHDAQQLALTVDGLKRELHEIRPEAHLLRAEVKGLIRERNEVRNAAQIEATQLRAEVERLAAERDAAQAEVERLQGDVERLRAERDQMATHPRGRELGRYGWGGHYIDAMEPERPSDEDIWRQAFITMLPSYPWEKAAEKSDCVLVEYRKRWPR